MNNSGEYQDQNSLFIRQKVLTRAILGVWYTTYLNGSAKHNC
ncbi:MAG: hypothetical protein ACI9US_000589 [Gammaproteobacteria bacterium]|jgi:hypothetical protein